MTISRCFFMRASSLVNLRRLPTLAFWLCLTLATVDAQGLADPRNIENGTVIPVGTMKYVDQPYVLKTADGAWACMLTVGTLGENVKGSQNFCATTRSFDQGKTWSPLVPTNLPYAVPYRTATGRLYSLSPSSYAWSDDNGASWSTRQAMPAFSKKSGWAVCLPLNVKGSVMFPWAMIGQNDPPRQTEIFLLKSPNLETEPDPLRVTWSLLPANQKGLRGPDWDQPEHRSEEPQVVQLRNGTLYLVFRTDQGYIGTAQSKDDGQTWSPTEKLRFMPATQKEGADAAAEVDLPLSRVLKHPLACPSLWKCSNGKYLLFFHNYAGKSYGNRNPAWISGGVETPGGIAWSQPEILLYAQDRTNATGRISYPGFLEDRGHYFIFETQKTLARSHEIDPSLLEGLWNQATAHKTIVARAPATVSSVAANQNNAGLSLVLELETQHLRPGTVLAKQLGPDGKGFLVSVARNGAISCVLRDGKHDQTFTSDQNALAEGRPNHLAIVFDSGPRLVFFVCNGVLSDGGDDRPAGWARYSLEQELWQPGVPLSTAQGPGAPVRNLRVFQRYLTVSEILADYNEQNRKTGHEVSFAPQE